MARIAVDAISQRNNKLEAFLKKNLDEETFESIRTHEPCVVSSKKDGKAFKFVVLSDEWLYLTENPPKKVSEEVHLGNIVSIQLMNDFPDFLSGIPQENVQHVLIKYMTKAPQKRRSKPKPERRHSKDIRLLHSQAGNLTYRSSLAVSATGGLDGRKQSWTAGSISSAAASIRSLPRPLPTSGAGTTREPWKGGPSGMRLNATHTGVLRLAMEKMHEENNSDSDEYDKPTTSGTMIGNDLSKSDSRLAFLRKLTSANTLDSSDSEEESWSTENLDVYILNLTSPLLMLIRAAWSNYLIRETLKQDPEYLDRIQSTPDMKATTRFLSSEKLRLLFAKLKRELLQANTMEDIFDLLNELKVAAERNLTIKRLFWRTPDLYEFFIDKLKTYLPNSPSKYTGLEEDKSQRADELDFSILLLETLATMFRETEVLPHRLSRLQCRKGKAVIDLINLAVVEPQLVDLEALDPIIPSLTSIPSLTNEEIPKEDVELHKLANELNVAATIVLSELILIARQSDWDASNGNFINVCWLIDILDKITFKEAFVKRVVSAALYLITPNRNKEALSPVEAVLVFHQFSMLHTLMEYSPTTAALITQNFYEEFKYFVRGSVILQKLPKHYPIADTTIGYIEKVTSSVLGKEVRLALNKPLA